MTRGEGAMRPHLYRFSSIFVALAVVILLVNANDALDSKMNVLDPVLYSYHAHRAQNGIPDENDNKVGEEVRVTIPDLGTAKGHIMQTLFERDFSAFNSIPYAPQPDRFQVHRTTDPC